MIPILATEGAHPRAIPSGWRVSRVKDVLDFHNTRRIPLSAAERGMMVERLYDYYGASGIIDKVENYLFDGTYILVAEDGANLLSRSTPLAFLATGQFWVNNHAHILRPRNGGDVRFFVNLLESLDYAASVTGAAQPKLTMQNLGGIKIVVPSSREQQRIADYLDMSCAKIDAAVSVKRRQLETLDALGRAVVQRAVTRGLSNNVVLETTENIWLKSIPQGWKLVSLKRIAKIQSGLTLGKQYEGSLVERPYLRVGNVQDGRLNLDDVSLIDLPASVAAGVELHADDVLMTEGGDLDKLGRGHLWNGEIAGCLHQNHIFAVHCFRHKLMPRFLAYVTAAKYGRDYFEATGKRTTNLACTNATKVGEFPIPLPTLAEQKAICAYLDEKLGDVHRVVGAIESQIETLSAYRKSLIRECVTGQRPVPEHELAKVEAYG
jgi:type I restriction enzyme, S subunit